MPRILLLEDDQKFARQVQTTLEQAGFTDFVHFEELDLAVEHLSANPVDLVITDLFLRQQEKLKKRGGLTFISKLRQIDRRDTPIIAISGAFETTFGLHLKTSSKTLGATALLAKPFHPDELTELVKKLLAGKR